MINVTVCTPTYNRADTLHRVYESLLSQSNKNFEWIVIDDGSTDNTKSVVENWINEDQMKIRYYSKTNGGKVSAIKEGLLEAEGKLFLIADSDDRFKPETICVFLTTYESADEKETICGISCLCKDSVTNRIIGEEYPYSPMVSNIIEIEYKYHVTGEKWGIFNTSILRKFFEDEEVNQVEFISENYYWYQIANYYKTIFINEPLRSYYQGSDNALSSPFTTERHPLGMFLSLNKMIECTKLYYKYNIKKTLLLLLNLVYAAQKVPNGFDVAISNKTKLIKLIIVVFWPLGIFLNKIRRKQYLNR